MAENTNSISNIEIDVDGFPMIGADNIVVPPQAAIFKREESVFNFVDSVPETASIETSTEKPATTPAATTTPAQDEVNINNVLDSIITEEPKEPLTDDRPESTGRAKIDKSALVEYLKEKINSKDFVTFDDYDEKVTIDDYLNKLPNKDLHSLIDENLKLKEETLKKEVPSQFYSTLSEDLKLAYEYEANGGKDLKSLYRALGEVHQLRELDPTNENHQEEIVYEYLRNANSDWSEDEVKGQVEEWKDLGLIDKKASQLKPKLDKMKEQIVQYQLEEQKQFAEQRKQAAEQYINNVYEALKPSEIGGIKIDSKTQAGLYNGLVNANYKSLSGGQTNELGHLLEKYQYQEPNYQKIAKVLWILKDEEGYDAALLKKGATINTEETVKKLKTEQGNRSSSTSFDDGGNASRVVTRKISKQPTNPFNRA